MQRLVATGSADQTLDSIVVGFLAYLAAFYGILEYLNRYSEARRIRSWLGFDHIQLGTLAFWLALFFKMVGYLIGPVT